MAKLIDREYPFCSEHKEFRLVMRALRCGWIDGETASDLINQAVARVTSNEHLRESLSLIRTAITIDKRRMKIYWDGVSAELEIRREKIRLARQEIIVRRSELTKRADQ